MAARKGPGRRVEAVTNNRYGTYSGIGSAVTGTHHQQHRSQFVTRQTRIFPQGNAPMKILKCPHCATRVIPRADGACPSCQQYLILLPESQSADTPAIANSEIGLPKQSEAARQVSIVFECCSTLAGRFRYSLYQMPLLQYCSLVSSRFLPLMPPFAQPFLRHSS